MCIPAITLSILDVPANTSIKTFILLSIPHPCLSLEGLPGVECCSFFSLPACHLPALPTVLFLRPLRRNSQI